MRHCLEVGRAIAVVILVLAGLLAGRPARADIFYTVTVTGTITSGTDNGVFGGIGNLAGQAFTIEQIFDGTTATVIQNSSYPYQNLLPVGGLGIVSVNSHTYTIEAPVLNESGYFLASGVALNGSGSGYYDEVSGNISGVDANGNPTYARINVTSAIDDFVQSDLLTQYTFFYTVATEQTSALFMTMLDGSGFSGVIDSVLVVVPEPGTASLLVSSLAACMALRGRLTSFRADRKPSVKLSSPLSCIEKINYDRPS